MLISTLYIIDHQRPIPPNLEAQVQHLSSSVFCDLLFPTPNNLEGLKSTKAALIPVILNRLVKETDIQKAKQIPKYLGLGDRVRGIRYGQSFFLVERAIKPSMLMSKREP